MDTRSFFEEVSLLLACDRLRAEAVTTVVLQELKVRLTPGEGNDVAAQLPRELRRIWEEPTEIATVPQRIHRTEFVGRVRNRAILPDDEEADRAVRAVFRTLQRALGSPHGTEGEAGDIYAQLPKDLKALWLEAARMEPPRGFA